MSERSGVSGGPLGLPPAVLRYGFRPFFFLAGVLAPAAIAVWVAVLNGVGWPQGAMSPVRWHAHEMAFGFAGAAIAGFLLTAVPSWTGRRGFAGAPLAGLVALWLAARVALAPVSGLPPGVAALVDLAFFPALGAAIAPSLVRSGNRRNFPILGVLAVLFAADLVFHFPSLAPSLDGVRIAIDAVLVLVTLIGGRVVPAFTGNALRQAGIAATLPAFGMVDRVAIAATAAVLVVDAALPGSAAAGVLALCAGTAHAIRLGRWRSWEVRFQPIVLVLHVGYGWLALGFALRGLHALGDFAFAAQWLHALTVGAIATMAVAVMSRAALGHTARPIVASRATVFAYALLTAAGLVRVFAPVLWPAAAMMVIDAAAALWIAAFVAFLAAYAPVLLTPRVDGRPG